jgi:hypothetical protein
MFKATFYRQPFMSIDAGKYGVKQEASTQVFVESLDIGRAFSAARG